MLSPKELEQINLRSHTLAQDYCPYVFRKLRSQFGIDAGEYVRSLCGDKALREMSSPGKSGSVFFLSHDERFVCKTMNPKP